MPRFAKRDEMATAAAKFHCRKSFVAMDGTLRLGGRDWKEQRQKALLRAGNRCEYVLTASSGPRRCYQSGPPDGFNVVDVHHKVTKGRGGSDDMHNLVVLCRFHHTSAHPEKQPRWSKGEKP